MELVDAVSAFVVDEVELSGDVNCLSKGLELNWGGGEPEGGVRRMGETVLGGASFSSSSKRAPAPRLSPSLARFAGDGAGLAGAGGLAVGAGTTVVVAEVFSPFAAG